VQERRHPGTVVDRIVVPEQRLAAQARRHLLQMPWPQIQGADLGPGPEHLYLRVQGVAEILQIVSGARPEETVEGRIVAVVGRADDQLPRPCPRADPLEDLGLTGGEARDVAPHVVEEDRQAGDADVVELGELVGQSRLGLRAEVPIEFERTEAHAEFDPETGAMRREGPQRCCGCDGIGFSPTPAQPGVGLRRIDEEGVAVAGEECGGVGSLLPGPRSAVVSFDHP
jgi:hypothetical protein